MGLTKSDKKNLLPVVFAATLFFAACILQTVDDYISDWTARKMIALFTQYIFFGLLAYWTVSVISRVSDRSIRSGITVAIALMGMILFVRLLKYHAFYDGTTARYLWYSYYIPQCLAPVVLLLTLLGMDRKNGKPLAKGWYLLFLAAAALILLVFTNDLHEQVFSFAKGLKHSNEIYKWEWGYYLILSWIAVLYLFIGVLLYIKCRISGCRKKAWIPLALFIVCIVLCILREVFDPTFIRMPEAVVFSVVIVFESLIRIGFIPSNVNYKELFNVADVSASIADKNLNVVLSSGNAPEITHEQARKAANGSKTELSEDTVLRAKAIRGGEVLWTEDYSLINKINASLAEINQTLSEEGDLIAAENKLKEQRSKIEEQNNLYKGIFAIFRPHLKKIKKCFSKAKSEEEKEKALRLAVVYGVYLKRRSNLAMLAKDGQAQLSELLYAMRESTDALSFYGAAASVIFEGDGAYPIERLTLIYEFFEDCTESALPDLSACLVRLSGRNELLQCRIALDNVRENISESWRNEECEKLGATVSLQQQDETTYATLSFGKSEG
ncbi:MAG: hypothetical protein SPH68_01680 [Candidatus Borkfalkiaceae bacterium]|nr:hypothetical protein [Clostridia bacterium]MDY6222854.1 hypothetical protein [Christensenellaceae bacterium]